jgi:hypothetical protein
MTGKYLFLIENREKTKAVAKIFFYLNRFTDLTKKDIQNLISLTPYSGLNYTHCKRLIRDAYNSWKHLCAEEQCELKNRGFSSSMIKYNKKFHKHFRTFVSGRFDLWI